MRFPLHGLRSRPLGLPSFVAALTLAFTACSETLGPVDLIQQLPRELTVVETAIIEESNAFGLELLRTVIGEDARSNVVLSPFSASMALGMTLNGTDGTTFDAMRSTLGFDGMTQAEINEAYRGLTELLTTLDPTVRFDVANAIWANEDVAFHQSFFDAVAAAFGATTESRDFSDSATLDAINDWVDENTDGKIESILEQLDPALVMLLVNAIYFEGAWTTEFDPDDTVRRDFFRADDSTVQVDMMSLSDIEVGRGGGSDYVAAELPYGGEAFSMLVVMPQDARVFVETLDGPKWNSIIAGLTPGELDQLSLPKFTLSYDTFLNDALREMGMDVAFRPGADFTRMSPIGDQLCIDFVRQKTFIEVDEQGTKAAAVTAVGIGPTSFNGFIVDRPFLFAIRERLTGTILFTGMVGDPTAEDPGPEPFTSTCG